MAKNLFDLSGKVAIVTGASRGLGRAMALGLAGAGADVVVTDVLDTKSTVKEIEALGRKSLGLKVDVSKKSEVEDMVKKTLKQFGKIDILVNNAGIFGGANAEQISENDWDKVIAVNLKGNFLCAQAVGKTMIERKSGSIINIASVAGLFGSAGSAQYCASKAGIILLTKTMATEWGGYGIRVNAICPGLFRTDMTEAFIADSAFMKTLETRVALKRYGVPEELAGTAVYLASDASKYMTGHSLVVDGGWTIAL